MSNQNPANLSEYDQEWVNGCMELAARSLENDRNAKSGLVMETRPIQFKQAKVVSKADYERQVQWEEAHGVSLGEVLEQQRGQTMSKKQGTPTGGMDIQALQQQVAQLTGLVAQLVQNQSGTQIPDSSGPLVPSSTGGGPSVSFPSPNSNPRPIPAASGPAAIPSVGPTPTTTVYPVDLDGEPTLAGDILDAEIVPQAPTGALERAQVMAGEVQSRLSRQTVELIFNRLLTEVFHKKLGVDAWQPRDQATFQNAFRTFVTNQKLIDAVCKFVVGTTDSNTITEKHASTIVVSVAGFLGLYRVLEGYVQE